jgi:FixJ family two-component response regulator
MRENATIFVVDDDAAVRDSLRWVIESNGWKVEAHPSAEAFLNSYTPNRLGCLILDVRMPGMSGPELQKLLHEQGCSMPIIFISAHGTVPTAVRAMQAGAVDFIMKPFDNATLLERIDKCVGLARQYADIHQQENITCERLAKLTARERAVLDLVVAGKSNKVIAADLMISIKTVEAHRAKIMHKMQVKSLAELVRLVLTQPHVRENPNQLSR